MNIPVLLTADRTSTPTPTPRPATVSARRVDRARAREFGVGYGNSSGYATTRRYASPWGAPRFRCA